MNHSVIVPTSNRIEQLRLCLQALDSAQQPSAEWEVLVIDNSEEAARPANKEVVGSFGNSRFRYDSIPPYGLLVARHRGVELSSGQIVSFLDDDSLVSESWLQGMEEAFADEKVVLVGGPVRGEYESEPPEWLEHFWVENEWGRWLGQLSLVDFGEEPKTIPADFVFGCNYSIRRDVFEQARGTNPDCMPPAWFLYQGDGETALSVKVEALGHKAEYRPKCAVRHLVPHGRMTKEYFGNRAAYNGVHGSFTQLRREHGLGPAEGVPRLPNRWALVGLPQRVMNRLFPSRRPEEPVPAGVAEIKEHMQKRYAEGYEQHHRKAEADESFLEYVLRPDYMGEKALPPVARDVRESARSEYA